ncbi:hypothetical protein DNL40_16080 [Xylanimonas oleitrophica]|uniref:RAMA domain-containing protein n=1 Tax=Xylanimonas oleitrophica TaxID=2607479 RepID=A0A2W5WJU4_9MICO|nr:hypothetical protein DNL40_16080 [Xylanimonas oleitrophica]
MRRRSRTDRFAEAAESYGFAAHGVSSGTDDDPLAWTPSRSWDPASGEDPLPAPTPTEGDAIEFGEVFSTVSAPDDTLSWEPRLPAAEPSMHDTSTWEAPFEPPRPLPPLEPDPRAWDVPLDTRPWSAPEPWTEPVTSAPISVGEQTDPDLVALASTIGVATPLVWTRPRRRQRFEALLHPDGVIEVADGGRYRHPDVAASAVSGSYTADGWSVWRVGSDEGPTLTEAFRARFA